MFEDVLKRIQLKVRTLQYVMTIHAEEEMDDDGLSIYDVEEALLTGVIIARQPDNYTNEWKYIVRGRAGEDRDIEVVVKLSSTDIAVIITVYLV